MHYIDITLPEHIVEEMFPACGEEGTFVEPNAWVQRVAHAMLGESEAIQWHCPNVFSIRYGSSYVATATAGVLAIRFHSNEGDFQEGDDK